MGSPNVVVVEDVERKHLEVLVNESYKWYDFGCRAWSFGYHSLVYCSAIFSAAASIILKLDSMKTHNPGDISAVLAGLAALCATLIAGGGFDRKWKANRVARGAIKQLEIELTDPKANLVDLRHKLEDIVLKQDQAIAGYSS